jgi:hypothetical protein
MTAKIESALPKNWHALQSGVARILNECGFETHVEKTIKTVRGRVEIDVLAIDRDQQPSLTYLCECKLWRKRVPKTAVHSLRTVMSDYGANVGIIVSAGGFQSGAIEAAKLSAVHCLTYEAFQQLFLHRWFHRHFLPGLRRANDSLTEYTEPVNTRILLKADALPAERRQRFSALREQYAPLSAFALFMCSPSIDGVPPFKNRIPTLPLRDGVGSSEMSAEPDFPANILDATAFRPLLDGLVDHFKKETLEFDEVFGERA